MDEARNLAAARAAWTDLPDWVEALAREADATSQVRAAERIGLSPGAVNQVLRGRYQASTDRIETRVRGQLMAAVVACPVMGELATDLCQEWQDKARGKPAPSSVHVRMWRACRACTHNRNRRED